MTGASWRSTTDLRDDRAAAKEGGFEGCCGKPRRGDFLASFPSTASSPSAITALAADDSGVYFFQVGVGYADIDRVAPAGGSPARLSPVDGNAEPQSLLLTADALIWPDGRSG
jgi:hypothetical protein